MHPYAVGASNTVLFESEADVDFADEDGEKVLMGARAAVVTLPSNPHGYAGLRHLYWGHLRAADPTVEDLHDAAWRQGRCAMAFGHQSPRTAPSKCAGYRVGGSPVLTRACSPGRAA